MSSGSSTGPSLGLGVDIGGTKIAVGVVDEDGAIVRRSTRPTPESDIAQAVAEALQDVRGDDEVGGIGIGAAGFVDIDRSTIRFAPNIDWRDEPLGSDVAKLTDLPVVVENDAAAAAWGEFRFGAGADSDDLLLVTLGTGVGGGVVHQGRLFRGGFGIGAEVGHLRLVPDGLPCGCGQRGCLEQYASGTALVRDARSRLHRRDDGFEPLLERAGSLGDLRGPMITELAVAGDLLCQDVLHDAGVMLGEALASLAAVLDPTVIALGGGVADAGDLLLEPTRRSMIEHLPARGHRPEAEVRIAELGNDAGLIGAADLGRAASRAR